MRRRQLLTGAAGLAGGAALGLPRRALADPAAGLDDLLYGRAAAAAPVPLATLCAATEKAHEWFRAARYDELSRALPGLLAVATATREHADPYRQAEAAALLADAHLAASALMVKTNDDRLAWATADRAAQAAAAAGAPLILADARRAVAIVLRRTGRPAKANQILLAAAADIQPGAHPTGDELSMYGTLLQVAAYTAAVDGNRHTAHELIGEARQAADRLGHDANHRHTTFGPAGVTIYQVSIARSWRQRRRRRARQDNAAGFAAHPRTPRPPRRRPRPRVPPVGQARRLLPRPPAGRTDRPRRGPLRPPVHRMVQDLLSSGQRLPGMRTFAQRIALPT